MRYISIALMVIVPFSYGLTCDEILELPAKKKLSLHELQATLPKDIARCVGNLGSEKLSRFEAHFIWQSIKIHYKGVVNIPDSVLMALHWVTPAIMPEEYSNITLNDIDVIQNFGLPYDLHKEQLSAIANRIREDFSGKKFKDYTYYDLSALGQIVCAFNRIEIEMIHPSVYRDAAYLIGKLKHCSDEVLAGFATLAIQPSAFGSPEYWTDNAKEMIGNIAKYLPRINNG